jgi:multidrug resistance efflux pump
LADTRNLKLRTALNRLDVARRDLGHTRVLAVGAGRVANLQLRPGDFVQTGSPVMALVGTAPIVAADFREKTLARVRLSDRAFVTFDAKPGEVYPGRVDSIDAGIAQGQLNADGALVQTVETDRWIRRAERVRVNILLDEPLSLTSGARATVQISPSQGGVWARIAAWQIRLVALFRYVY